MAWPLSLNTWISIPTIMAVRTIGIEIVIISPYHSHDTKTDLILTKIYIILTYNTQTIATRSCINLFLQFGFFYICFEIERDTIIVLCITNTIMYI